MHDAEIARARAAVRIPPGIPELMSRLREQYPDAKHIDYGERAELEEHIRSLKNVRLVEHPGSSQIIFLSKRGLEAFKKQLGRERARMEQLSLFERS